IGTQYRSVIFFDSLEQERIANTKIIQLTTEKIFPEPIVTQVVPLIKFYEAEDYHHDYFVKNPEQTYCQLVINPKLKKFKDRWIKLLKNNKDV
ncbi:MAG: peptide-methionine (S)-S-oxide reductase, partial [Patescibacteria group bacterium]